jgi:cell wall integrity and stress response component
MASSWCFLVFLYIFTLLQTPIQVAGLSIQYCSSANTGSQFDAVISDFQSNGACRETCVDKFAFAILQGKYCWCSNVAPGVTTDTKSCDDRCPGYPADRCGNVGSGLFGYMQLDKRPSATAGDSTKPTVAGPMTSAQSTGSPIASISAVSVQTVSGQIVTITVSSGGSQPTSGGSAKPKGSSLSPGGIAGIIIGALVALGLGVALIMWCCCIGPRRARASAKDDYDSIHYEPTIPPPIFQGTLQSRPPQMSVANSGPTDGPVTFPRSSRHPHNPNRLSVPAFTDNRMKKDLLIYPNGSRHSNVSLQDHHDYSRPVLRLTNPDPANT